MDPYIGEIRLFAFPSRQVPAGWQPCDGRALRTAEFAALFWLLGTAEDGDARTFLLPDLRDHAPAPGLHYCIATAGTFPQND